MGMGRMTSDVLSGPQWGCRGGTPTGSNGFGGLALRLRSGPAPEQAGSLLWALVPYPLSGDVNTNDNDKNGCLEKPCEDPTRS